MQVVIFDAAQSRGLTLPSSPTRCCLAVKTELLDVTEPATILVPTDMAWMEWMNAAPDEPTATQRQQLAYINIAIVSYHEIPKVTVRSADMRDGMSLGPTNLPDSGSITIHIAPNTHVIRFTGFDRQGSAARYATLLYPDIKLLGGNGVVMHVVDTLLLPPTEASATFATKLALGLKVGSQGSQVGGSP
jgi:hypothetical protein